MSVELYDAVDQFQEDMTKLAWGLVDMVIAREIGVRAGLSRPRKRKGKASAR